MSAVEVENQREAMMRQASEVALEEIYHLGDINERAIAVGLTEAYSEAIRESVPSP